MDANGVLAAAFDSATGALRITPGAAAVQATGLTGATATTRYAGGTTTGPPTTGTFQAGDFVIAQDGVIWICTVAGSPGTWTDGTSSGRELAAATSSTNQTGIAGTATDLTNLSITFTVAARPVWVEVLLPSVYASTASAGYAAIIADGSGTVTRKTYGNITAANLTDSCVIRERISTPGSYTRKVQLQRASGTGTLNNNLDSSNVSSIRAITA